jgi:hypothetical protein
LQRLRAEASDRKLIVLAPAIIAPASCGKRPLRWTSRSSRCRATFMPVEALWRWLREDVTDQHCHASLDGLETSVADFQDKINQDPIALADRLALKTQLDPDVEKLRIPK